MLSLQAIGDAEYYLELAREDYFLDGGEPPGQWCGRGAKALGLTGLVTPAQLKGLIAGFGPDGLPLIQNAGKANHQAGWDLTCSDPKVVSVLWCAACDQTRYDIQGAHFEAVKAMVRSLERNVAFTRRGKRGSATERVGLVAAAFEHGTSRALDPQLHTHLLVLNIAPREDGTTGTILSLPLYQFKMVAGALFRAELAANLRKLGFAAHVDGTSFLIEGVPDDLIKCFSKRRAQIEEFLRSQGASSAKAAALANLLTRDAKSDVARSELFTRWQATAKLYGLTAESIEALRHPYLPPPSQDEVAALVTKAVRQLVEEQSHFNEFQLLRRVAEAAPAIGAGIVDIEREVTSALRDCQEIVYLGELEHDKRFTTERVLKREEALLTGIDRLLAGSSHVAPRQLVDSVLARHTQLFAEQQWAIEHLAATPGDIKVVDGMPGTGKTYMLAVCREIWEQQGLNVIGCSISAKATRELADGMGIPCVTTAKLLHELDRDTVSIVQHHANQIRRAALGQETYSLDIPRIDNRTVVVMDEAGMADTRTLLRMQQEVERAGGMLVLVGDRRQIPAVGAGGGFEAIGDRIGRVELTEMRRQANPLDTLAVQKLADSQVQDVLQDFQHRGILQVAPTRFEAMERLVADWKERGLRDPQNTTIIASTNFEAACLNRLCQEERLKQDWHNPLLKVQVRDEHFFNGDRVQFLENNRLLGVDNGDSGTVTHIDPITNTLTIKLDRSEECVTVDLANYDELQLSYAKTTHKLQGSTVDHAYVLMGGSMQSKEISFVQVSRHVVSLRIYTDAIEAGENLEHLAAQIASSRAKQLACAVREQVRELSTLENASLPAVPPPSVHAAEKHFALAHDLSDGLAPPSSQIEPQRVQSPTFHAQIPSLINELPTSQLLDELSPNQERQQAGHRQSPERSRAQWDGRESCPHSIEKLPEAIEPTLSDINLRTPLSEDLERRRDSEMQLSGHDIPTHELDIS